MSDSPVPSDLPAIFGGIPIRPEGPPAWPGDWPEVADAMQAAFQSGDWGRYHGPHCRLLRESLAEFHDIEHAQLCSRGTAAVELSLRGAKVGPGDEVILAAYDFKSNFQNVLAIGATPVLVDLDPHSWQINPSLIAEACSERTRAVIVSHLHGGLVDMKAVMSVASARGLTVIEDACQATGAVIDGNRAGTIGDVGVLSFGGSKLLTAGRGGAVMTNRADIAQRIRLYVNRGNDAYPLSELQATVLHPQLARLTADNGIRSRNVAHLLDLQVSESGALRVFGGIEGNLMRESPSTPSFYKLGFTYTSEYLDRSRFCQAMRAEGIAFDPGFDALHQIHSRRRFRTSGDLPVADLAHEQVVMLHHPVLLERDQAMQQIVDAIARVERHAIEIQNAQTDGC